MPIGVVLCGTYLSPLTYDRALTSKHLIWCAMVIVIALCTREIRVGKIHILALGFFICALASYPAAINKSEWLYSVLRIVLMISYLSVAEIDMKIFSKTMVLLGVIFTIYFWYEYYHTGSFLKCSGLMGQRNYWACANFFVLPFCYYAKRHWKLLSSMIAVSMLANILLLQSRTAILAVILSGIVLALTDKKLRIYAIAAVYFIIAGVFYFNLTNTESLGYRLEQWDYTLNMIQEHPMGVGAGNWWIEFPNYAFETSYPGAFYKEIFRFPHNDYLWICAEIGIFGFVCYLGMIVLSLCYAWHTRQNYLLIGLSGIVSISFFTAMYERAFLTMMVVTFIALACPRKPVKQPKILLSLLIFALVVFGFRYRASTWNKKLKLVDPKKAATMAHGYSIFSTMSYNGVPWHWYKGIDNYEKKNISLSFEQLNRAYRYNPNNIFVINGMGIATATKGNYIFAKAHFKRAIEICPDFPEAKENLAKLR